MKARVGFTFQVTATPGFHSLYDWCFQTIWLFSVTSEEHKDETLLEMHNSDALNSAVKGWMHAIRTEYQDTSQDAAHRIIQIAKPCKIRRWSESKLASGRPLVQITMENALLVDFEWTEEEQAELKTLVERYTSQDTSEVWMVHRWRLACVSLVLGDTDDWNEASGQWDNE
jgi:hypothetical protein